MSHSVTALPRRSSGTFSCVLIRRRVCKYTLTYLQPWVLHPLLALINTFLYSKPVLLGISDRGPVKDTTVQPLHQVGNSIDCDPRSSFKGTLATPVRAYLAVCCLNLLSLVVPCGSVCLLNFRFFEDV
jgi:hypothetical protein